MKFTKSQLVSFGAQDGAWSEVTSDERSKSQITISDSEGEAEVAIRALGRKNIPRTPAKGKTEVKIFKRDGTCVTGKLTIKFPKAGKDELRIYRNVRAGFDYESGDIWFVCRKGRTLTVGSMPKRKWEAIARDDSGDAEFQTLIENAAHDDTADSFLYTSGGLKIKRDPKKALNALKRARFKCEYDPKTKLFISRATGNPYVEAHHFIPLSARELVSGKLDIIENIVALSPHWHRAIHYGEDELVREILDQLAKNALRKSLLKKKKLVVEDLFEIYGV